MIEIDRRSVMAGIAATAGAGLLPAFDIRSAKAAAPPAGTQNAGWYRYKVGTHEVTVVTDGANVSSFRTASLPTRAGTKSTRGWQMHFFRPPPT